MGQGLGLIRWGHSKWVALQIRVPFRVYFIRMPYYIGDLNRDPSLENYPSSAISKVYILLTSDPYINLLMN